MERRNIPSPQRLGTFWRDLRRYGLSAALRRKFGSFDSGRIRQNSASLSMMSQSELERTAARALAEGDYLVVCWAFEAMVERSGDINASYAAIWRVIVEKGDFYEALPTIMSLLRSVDDPGTFAAALGNDTTVCYLVGKFHLDEARKYRNSNKAKMETNKARGLIYFGGAREQIARNTAVFPHNWKAPPDMERLIAKGYEECMYLMYEGTASQKSE